MGTLSQQADDIRIKAAALFNAQHPRIINEGLDVREIAELPNGPTSVLRVSWLGRSRGTRLSIRGFERAPDGRMFAMGGFGLSIQPSQVPLLAAALADALDQIMVTDHGLDVVPPVWSDGARSSTGDGRR